MKLTDALLISAIVTLPVMAQRTEPSSKTDPKLEKLLKNRPELDANKDGTLTLTELRESRGQKRERPQQQKQTPTYPDVSYGPHASMQLDFWKANSDQPTPLFIFIHGGGFRSGDKASVNPTLLNGFLKAGVSVASINYRLSGIGPYPMQMHDSARAVQFLRSKANDWNINPNRVAAGGGSAGSGISQWLGFHNDLKKPKSIDPIEQQSTRLSCILAFGMQSTLDPRVIREIIPGDAYNDKALKPFYGLPDDWNWDTDKIDEKLDALIKDASPINHLTADDPPVFIFHSEKQRTPGNIHHPNFGEYLAEAMDKLEIEQVRRTDADYDSRTEPFEDMVQFVLRHLNQTTEPGE